MSNFPDEVALKVLHIYESCPKNGKPNCSESIPSEYTVMAAIVATTKANYFEMDEDKSVQGSDLIVVSMATGTKCAGKGKEDPHGFITSDSHAEVLARRGFIRWLAKSVLLIQNSPILHSDPHFPLEIISKDTTVNADLDEYKSAVPYVIKKNWHFYLYVSDSPCGDASIYSRMTKKNQVASFTGAKLIRPDKISRPNGDSLALITDKNGSEKALGTQYGCCLWEREDEQELGVVRTKSGRSDIKEQNRTSSMSCSDKICRLDMRSIIHDRDVSCEPILPWLGLQGSLLSLFLRPVYLSGIVIGLDPTASSKDEQSKASHRAFCIRLKNYKSSASTYPKFEYSSSIPEIWVACSSGNEKACFRNSKGNADLINNNISPPNSSADIDVDIDSEASCSGGSRSNKDNSDIIKINTRKQEDGVSNGKVAATTGKKIQACGTSINWVKDVYSTDFIDAIELERKRLKVCTGGTVEVTVAETGALQGTTKASVGQAEGSSRLSRRSSSHLFASLVKNCSNNSNEFNAILFLLSKSLLTPRNDRPAMRVAEVMATKAIDEDLSDNRSLVHVDTELEGPNNETCRGSNDVTSANIDNATDKISEDVIIQNYESSVEKLLEQPYMWWKSVNAEYSMKRARFLSTNPFNLWLSDDPLICEQFPLEIAENVKQLKGVRKRDSAQLKQTRSKEGPHDVQNFVEIFEINATEDEEKKNKRTCVNENRYL